MITKLRNPPIWLIGFIVLLIIGCRGSFDIEEARTPRPAATSTLSAFPTSTPPPLRLDCSAIVSSGEFSHIAEQNWYLENCLIGPELRLASSHYNQIYGIGGARFMEFFTVDTAICETGFLSLTVLHQPDREAFSYLFRTFCSDLDPIALAFPPPPFACTGSEVIQAVEVSLKYMTGLDRQEREVFCSPAADSKQIESGMSVDPWPAEWTLAIQNAERRLA